MIHGGSYGGGNSFMVLALLAHTRVPTRTAAHAKNLLILLMHVTAAAVFVASRRSARGAADGSLMIDRIGPVSLRRLVIELGTGLAAWLAVRG